MFADNGMGVGEKARANFGASIDCYETVQNGVITNFDIFINKTVGSDVRTYGDPGRGSDYGSDMHGWAILGRLVKQFDGLSESQVRVRGTQGDERLQAVLSLDGDAIFDENCGGLGVP
jgi:hypothetical protein